MAMDLSRRLRLGASVATLVLAGAATAAQADPKPEPDVAASAGSAPVAPADPANGRFTMTPVANGFLRLDTRTGQVSLCTLTSGEAQCRASADERAALEAEIDRLAQENARLKAAAPRTASPAADEEERRIDRALDRAERFMRRMLQLFRESGGETPPSKL